MVAINTTLDFLHKIKDFALSIPDKVMFVDENATRQTTYAEFWTLIQKIAYLINQRMQGKERLFVPIYLSDSMEYFASEFAIWMTGNAAVHMGLSFPKERVDYIMHHCEAEFMIDGKFIEEARQLNEIYTNIRPRTSDQPCAMFYTSGSTGNPKGVLHSDAGFLKSALADVEYKKMNEYDSFTTIATNYFVAVTFSLAKLYYGKTLYIMPNETKTDPVKLLDFISRNNIKTAFISPSVLRSVYKTPGSLKIIYTGSERLVGCYPEECLLYNSYGLTETAGPFIFKLMDKGYDNSPLGRPCSDIELTLLDNEGNEVPEGEVGELCIKSGLPMPQYFKDPERTADLTRAGVMHSGDLMKRLPNGEYLYVQRKDWMVKINGQRVEPGEVEAVIRNIAGVKDAIVKGFTTDDLTRQYLVGYYILEEGSVHDADSIKTELKKKVPSYMVPQYMVQMDAFPLNANNKIDRKSLLPPDLTSMQSEYVTPTNEVEKAICDAFAKVLEIERVGIEDDFFLLGGDSIRLMELQQTIQYDIPANIVLKQGTPRKIAAFITENISKADEIAAMTDYPLNSGQLFFLQQALAAPDSSQSYFPIIHRLPLSIDAERLKTAVENVVNAHPSMMLKIVTNEQGEYRMQPTSETWHMNVDEMTDSEFEELRPNLFRCFRYLEEVLFEIKLIKTECAIYLYHNMHHIITDGVSNQLLFNEISLAYSGAKILQEEQTIFELNAEMESTRHSEVYEECKDWFAHEFEGSLSGKDTVVEGEMKTYKKILNIPSHQQMDALCTKYGVTLNALFMAVVAKAIDKDVNCRDVRLTASFHGRMSQKCQRTFGFLATPRLYRFYWNEQESMIDYLNRSKEHIMGNMARIVLSMFELLQTNHLPLDAIMFIYQGQIGSNLLVLDGVEAETQKLPTETPSTRPLCIFVYDKGKTDFSIEIWYDSSKYSQEYTETLTKNFEMIINNL